MRRHTSTRELRCRPGHVMTIRGDQRQRHFHVDPDLGAPLSPLQRHRRCHREDDDVVDRPEHVHDHGVAMRRIDRVAMPPHDESGNVQPEQAQEGKRNTKVEVRPIDDAALARDVESAEARVDQREQRRKQICTARVLPRISRSRTRIGTCVVSAPSPRMPGRCGETHMRTPRANSRTCSHGREADTRAES